MPHTSTSTPTQLLLLPPHADSHESRLDSPAPSALVPRRLTRITIRPADAVCFDMADFNSDDLVFSDPVVSSPERKSRIGTYPFVC